MFLFFNVGIGDKKDVIEDLVSVIVIFVFVLFVVINVVNSGIIIVLIVIFEVMFEKVIKFLVSLRNVILKLGVIDGFFIVVGVCDKIYVVKFGKGGFLVCDCFCVNNFIKICEYIIVVV